MNKKKLVAGLLASASVLGVCLSGGTAFATEQDSQDTTVGIGFGDHTDGGNGPLKLEWLPKSLNFGDGHEVNAQDFDFPLKDASSPKYVIVSDTRPDVDRIEWKLTAKLSELKSAAGNKLNGSSLNFTNTMMAYSGTDHPNATNVVAPTPGQQTATITEANASLDAGASTATEIMQDKGGPTGTNSFNGKTATQLGDIKLKVRANSAAEKQTYTGTVTWSLDDTI